MPASYGATAPPTSRHRPPRSWRGTDALYPAERTAAVASQTLAAPTLFLHGALDTQSLLSEARALESRFSARSDAIFARCVGHFVARDASECAAGAVRAFVAGTPWSAAEVAECEARVCEALPILSGSAPSGS